MPMKIGEIRKLQDDEARGAAAEELLAYALNIAKEARKERNDCVRKLKAKGVSPKEIAQRMKTAAPTVKALTR